MTDVRYRKPKVGDASTIFELVKHTPALDLNSWYYYAIFFRDFSDTSMVAEVNGEVAGFVTGYLRPQRPDTLFLWQTATTLTHGVTNLGLHLIAELVDAVQQRTPLAYVEATIDPNNRAISMQFRMLARLLKTDKSEELAFSADHFSELEHDEQLIRIGPLS
ncbi:diaminobutyrate acetyltransferase [Janibacter melonis]|uniref:diaminobutyrate acetyltransferase n=1 Tax=Janibacter melonis TaxID=262209 RepID=UPI0020434B09|nr:diaminobutyrate acetyltransferase [Janibacter melonis]MCM3556838.1 diaminobutyrate acetyltransferase [Janibacter melonis]